MRYLWGYFAKKITEFSDFGYFVNSESDKIIVEDILTINIDSYRVIDRPFDVIIDRFAP